MHCSLKHHLVSQCSSQHSAVAAAATSWRWNVSIDSDAPMHEIFNVDNISNIWDNFGLLDFSITDRARTDSEKWASSSKLSFLLHIVSVVAASHLSTVHAQYGSSVLLFPLLFYLGDKSKHTPSNKGFLCSSSLGLLTALARGYPTVSMMPCNYLNSSRMFYRLKFLNFYMQCFGTTCWLPWVVMFLKGRWPVSRTIDSTLPPFTRAINFMEG